MLAAIKGAVLMIISTAMSVVTLPLRVLRRLVGGVPTAKRRRAPRRRAS